MRFNQSRFFRLLPHDCQDCGPLASSRRERLLARSNEGLSSYSTMIALFDRSRMRSACAMDIRRRGEECQHLPITKIIERTNCYLPNWCAIVSWDLAPPEHTNAVKRE